MDDSRRCSNCKHWFRPKRDGTRWEYDEILYPVDEDTYELKEMPFELGLCQSPKLTKFERTPFEDGCTVRDGSDYVADLITAPNYGCVNWE